MKKILIPLLFLSSPALAADDELLECRQIEDIEKRLTCYDQYVDSQHKTAEPNPVPDAEFLFGTNDAEVQRIVETTLAIEQIDHIVATVSEVRKSATNKLTVTLDNGQVWRQLDSQPLRLKSGESVIVREASLSSYLMAKQSGGRSIRVKRAN